MPENWPIRETVTTGTKQEPKAKCRAGHTHDNLTPFKGHSDTERQTFVWTKGLNKLSHCRLLEYFKMSHIQLSLDASVIRISCYKNPLIQILFKNLTSRGIIILKYITLIDKDPKSGQK